MSVHSLHPLIAVTPMAQQPPRRRPMAAAESRQTASRPRYRLQSVRPAEIGIDGIAVLRGISHRPHRAIVRCIRLLIDKCGFPEPRTPRFVKGRRLTGAAAVKADSRWNRDQVEAWFEKDLPPGESAALAAADADQVRAELAERARELAAA